MTGAKSDAPLAHQIARMTKAKPIIAAGRTSLMELAALIQRCQVFIVSDTAPLHIAAALGVPTVALFGSTDPARHAPPSSLLRVLRHALPCSPCYRPTCYRLGTGHMECMRRLSVEAVFEAVAGFLRRGAPCASS